MHVPVRLSLVPSSLSNPTPCRQCKVQGAISSSNVASRSQPRDHVFGLANGKLSFLQCS
jgi:hypothetical protein